MARLTASGKEPVGREEPNRSARKRKAILDAATEVFLRDGYLGTNMDEIAALSEVSKQTVYKHFASKEALFIEIVSSMTTRTGDSVHTEIELEEGGDLSAYLQDYAYRQLSVVLTPRVMQLRRLVIGEVSRFPELAKVLYERGPMRAIGGARGDIRAPGRARSAGDRRSHGRGLPIQLADHVRPFEPGHAVGRRGDTEAGGTSPACGRRRARIPCGIRQEIEMVRPFRTATEISQPLASKFPRRLCVNGRVPKAALHRGIDPAQISTLAGLSSRRCDHPTSATSPNC